MSLAVKPASGPGRILDLAADVAFAGEAWSWVWDAVPLVTLESDIEPHQLAELLHRGFFSPSDDADADSWERQRDLCATEAHHLATKLLVSDEAARTASIADAVARELFWLIPHDRGVDIAVRDRTVTVTFAEPVPAAGVVSEPPAARAARHPTLRRPVAAACPSNPTTSPRPPGARPAPPPGEGKPWRGSVPVPPAPSSCHRRLRP